MTVVQEVAPPEEQSPLVLFGYSWEQYLSIEKVFEETGTKVRFLRGRLEIMPPVSENHEVKKSHIGCLIEAWCLEKEIEFFTRGNFTMLNPEESGGEPDESYSFGEAKKKWPDLIVEVALTSGGLSKREFYATFPVPELWIWRKGALEVHLFDKDSKEYVESDESQQLPGIDLDWLVECSKISSTSKAIKTFREKI